MNEARVVSVVRARYLLIPAVLVSSFSPPASPNPVSPSASVLKGPPPTPKDSTPVSLSAIQRLNARVGYVAADNRTGPGLAKTSDGGTTWQRVPIPAESLSALRFINE